MKTTKTTNKGNTMLKNTKINFVSAEDGKVFLSFYENGIIKEKGSENPIILADIMKKHGFLPSLISFHAVD